MKKRVLAFLLMTLICLGLATPAFAAEEAAGQGYKITWLDYSSASDVSWITDIPELNWAALTIIGESNVEHPVFDLATGKQIEAYDYVRHFSEGLAAVVQNRKCGYVDTTGKVVVPLEYDDADSFSEGLAAVGQNGKYGYIDKTGQFVISPKYDYAQSFSEGLAAVYMNGKYGYIDKTGQIVISPKYDYAESFSDGLAKVMVGKGETAKYGLIDKTGKVVLPIRYSQVWLYHDGVAIVESQTGQYGVVDKTGKFVVPLGKYDEVGEFSDGLARVTKDEVSGFVDTTGKEVLPLDSKYKTRTSFSDGLIPFYTGSDWGEGKFGYMNKAGETVIPPTYDWIEGFSDGRAVVTVYETNGETKIGVIDQTGKVIVPLGKYDVIGVDSSFYDGLIAVEKNGKQGIIDTDGKEVVPPVYDQAYCIGTPWVRDGNKIGVLTKGSAASGSNGTASGAKWVKSDGYWKYQDASGSFLTGWQKVNGSWYYMNTNGVMLTGWQKVGGKWYYLNSSGAMLTGWQKISGKWYYLYADGSMAANTTVDGYTVGKDGAWIK